MHNLQWQRRRSAAGSDVDDDAIAIVHVGRGKNGLDDQPIDRVFGRVIEVKRRQIDPSIPAGEKRQVLRERRDSGRTDASTRGARRARIAGSKSTTATQTVAARLDNRAATMATAAGVTPGTREA